MSWDAVVVGAGHNGLVAANVLADAGWSVLVLEAQDEPGGTVRSRDGLTEPGFVSDRFSAFYPLGYASPALRALRLEEHGLRWVRSEAALAHPDAEGRCALLSTDLEETMASLDAFAPGDGEAWRALYGLYERVGPALLDGLMTPFPPLRAGARIARRLGSGRELLRFARFGLLPVRRLADETFAGEGGGWLLGGNALHTDLTPEAAGSGVFGWLLTCLGQHVGFPVPEGGSGMLTQALVRRLEAAGGRVECGHEAQRIVVRDGRAVGVDDVGARRAVLADTTATALYDGLLPRDAVPRHVLEDLGRFQPDAATVKLDWALDAPIPWTARAAGRAGTVHVAEGMDGLTRYAADLACGRVPERPFLILGQYSMVDPTRCPPGREVAWAYTHVPSGADADAVAGAMEAEVERLAPGFSRLIRSRAVTGLPPGVVNHGTAQLHQQLVFRPLPGLGRPETPVRGVFLASAAAHPGGGVHGGPGANAARAALAHARLRAAGADRLR